MYQIDKPDNVVELLEQTIAKFPQRPYFGTKNKEKKQYDWITYEDFGKRVDNVRSGLHQMGVTKDDAVGIISNNSESWAACFYATSGLAARFVPMYEAELVQTWKYIITDSKIKVLLVSKKAIYDKIQGFTSAIPTLQKVILMEGDGPGTLSELEKKGAARKVKSIYPDPSSICILIYTSGTTGEPKGALLSQGNITSANNTVCKDWPTMNENDRSCSILPWAHVYGLGEILSFGRIGSSIGLAESPATLAEDFMMVKPTHLSSVPRVFNMLYDGLCTKMKETGGLPQKLFLMGIESGRERRRLAAQGKSSFMANLKFKIADAVVFSKVREKLGGRLCHAMTASALMNEDISGFFWDIGVQIFDCYGMTETSGGVTMNSPSKYRFGSVGPVMSNCKIVIDQSVVEPGAKDGEIVVYGPIIMQGYNNKPEASTEVMLPDGGLRTGDRGRLDDDGFLYITGRLKEQYKLENGKYVFPASLEEDIRLNHYIDNAMIYGEGRQYNICLVVPNYLALGKWAQSKNLPQEPAQLIKTDEARNFLADEVVNSLKGKYGSYEIPKKFIFLNEAFTLQNGMLTQTMKVKRRVVSEKYKDQINALYSAK